MSKPTAFGPWTVERTITAGSRGNADVYEVSGVGSRERLALKTPHGKPGSEPYRRFQSEVAFHSQFQDAGVLPMVEGLAPDTLSAGEHAWLVMPIASPFDHELADAALPQVVQAISQVAATLTRLSRQGVHHRDIKPQNLFLREGVAVIGDFGLVDYPGKPEVTGDGKHLGPIYYIAPEMLANPASANGERADVYSLAKTLWVLAAGQRYPFPGGLDVPQLRLRAHVEHPRAYRLEPLLERATQFDPHDRPTLETFADELRAWLDEPAPTESRPAPTLDEATARITALLAPSVKGL